MEITPLNISTLNCFCCNIFVAKHRCKLRISDDIFINVCLCDICVKRDETELRMKFMGKSGSSKTVEADAESRCPDCDGNFKHSVGCPRRTA